MDPKPIALCGPRIRLEPVSHTHTRDLYEVGRDESIWRYLPTAPFKTPEDAENWVQTCIDRNDQG